MEPSSISLHHDLVLKPCLNLGSSQSVFQMNSKYLITGSETSERQNKHLRLFQWKLSQWGNQLRTQEIDVSDQQCCQIKQMILSSFDDLVINRDGIEESQDLNAFPQTRERTLAYLIDSNNSFYEWSSDKKKSLSKVSLPVAGDSKLLSIHPNNLFFAFWSSGVLYIIQTFDKQIYAQHTHNSKIEKLHFDMKEMTVFFLDDSNTLSIFDYESSTLKTQKRIVSDSINQLTVSNLNSHILYFSQQSGFLKFLSQPQLNETLKIDLNAQIARYTDNNNQSSFILKQVYAIKQLDTDLIALSSQSQVIIVSMYYEAVNKIIYLERVNSRSTFFTLKSCLYLAAYSQYSGDLNFYNVMELNHISNSSSSTNKLQRNPIQDMNSQTIRSDFDEGDSEFQRDEDGISNYDDKDLDDQKNDHKIDENEESQEYQSVDIINEFAKQYDGIEEPKDLQYNLNVIDEEGEDDEESNATFQQSFKNTNLYADIAKQIESQNTQRSIQQPTNEDQNQDDFGHGLSVLQRFVPHPKSVFFLANQKIELDSIYDTTDNYNKTRFTSNLPQKYTKTNLPVTFHKKIKSSGYGSQPNSLKFSAKQKQKVQQQQTGPQYVVTKNFYSKPLPMTVPDELSVLRENPLHKNAVTRLCYSPLGTKLAAISQDTTISVLKTPMFQNQLDLTKLGGHNGPVNSIHFSASDQYLITASSDKSCIIWNLKWSKKGEKLLILDRLKKNKTNSENPLMNPLQQQQNPTLPDQIRGAQFYYEDKLLVLSCEKQLLFYQYELPDQSMTQDDVKRLQQKGLYKLIQTFNHPNAQHIPSFHFHNSRLKTHIGLIGGSNKELIVYDANMNKPISIMNDGHYKHIHTVKFYEGSYGDQEAYNTFLTASTDNYIKLWDLRVGSPVREFGAHQNRAIQIGFSVSNCYRYLISGSEDRSVYIYDVGSGEVIDRTKNSQHGDSVTDIAVNPEYYEWATSSIDGHMRIFRYPAQKVQKKVKPKNGGGGGFMVKGKKVQMAQSESELDKY